MTPLSRREREVRERQEQILEVARGTLAGEGYHRLRLDDVAKVVGCSKGTIFNDFKTKEEIVLALSVQSMQQRVALFQRAAAFRGLTRERVLAVGIACELFYRLHPEHFAFEHLIRSTSFWENTTEDRQREFRGCESQCVSTVGGVVTAAVAAGDLELDANTSPNEIVFGLWSMTYGSYSLLSTAKDSLSSMGIADPFATLRKNQTLLLDGYRWTPLASEHDYDAATQRILSETFAVESKLLART